jgi:hypothetical protein
VLLWTSMILPTETFVFPQFADEGHNKSTPTPASPPGEGSFDWDNWVQTNSLKTMDTSKRAKRQSSPTQKKEHYGSLKVCSQKVYIKGILGHESQFDGFLQRNCINATFILYWVSTQCCSTLHYTSMPCATLGNLELPWATLGLPWATLGYPWAPLAYLGLIWVTYSSLTGKLRSRTPIWDSDLGP